MEIHPKYIFLLSCSILAYTSPVFNCCLVVRCSVVLPFSGYKSVPKCQELEKSSLKHLVLASRRTSEMPIRVVGLRLPKWTCGVVGVMSSCLSGARPVCCLHGVNPRPLALAVAGGKHRVCNSAGSCSSGFLLGHAGSVWSRRGPEAQDAVTRALLPLGAVLIPSTLLSCHQSVTVNFSPVSGLCEVSLVPVFAVLPTTCL